MLLSATTRRNGIIANLDLGVDILNEFGLSNEFMIGRTLDYIEEDDNIKYLSNQYEKIVSINNIRSTVVNIFVGIVSISGVMAMLALLFKDKLPYKDKISIVLKEFIKLGLIMPLTLLSAPIFNAKTQMGIIISVIAMTILIYLSGRLLFKHSDIKQMSYYALLTIGLVVFDSIIGTFFMKYSVMSYDAIVGARYYGVGNEYQGVIIGSAIFGLAFLLVLGFAGLDLLMGTESHLGAFVMEIFREGPNAIILTFSRKISMNLKLAKSTVWVNILLTGIAVIGIFIFRPSRHMKNISNKYNIIFKGFIASMVGCIVTMLVNDSGIVSAATTFIYILIPTLIISINMIIFNDKIK